MSDYLDINNEELLKDFFTEAEQQVENLESNILVIENDPTNPLIPEIGWNYLKHRLRSHKEVAKRFYSDIYDPSNPANPIKASAF